MYRKVNRSNLKPQFPVNENRTDPARPFQIELLEQRAMLSGDPVAASDPPPSNADAGAVICNNADANVPAAQPVATQSFFVRGPEENP